ncbi:MAG: M20/M25/M40 family metallo-hydrolase, partial [Alphaproteobacteria bacterium]
MTSLEMLRRLVAFDTTSRLSNLELIDFVRSYLAGHGIASELVPNEDGKKANLIATIGPDAPGGIVLSGHTDVVPVDGQPWDTDPWTLTEKADGNLYGRGTCDMKAFSAVVLSMVPRFRDAGMKVPVHLALSYDEEVGCFGAFRLVERLVSRVKRPRACIVGEPTMMGVVNAQNTAASFQTVFTGHEAHSSMTHLGVSAVHFAGEFIHWLNVVQDELAARPRTDIDLVPPFTTINVGIVAGGTAGNILARECVVTWGYRTTPGEDQPALERRARAWLDDVLLPRMRARHPAARIETTRRGRCRPRSRRAPRRCGCLRTSRARGAWPPRSRRASARGSRRGASSRCARPGGGRACAAAARRRARRVRGGRAPAGPLP